MSHTTAAPPPKLAGMKYQVESILHSDSSQTVMLVNDPAAFSAPYALKVIKRTSPEDDAAIECARVAPEASGKVHHASLLAYHDFRVRRAWFRVSRAELLMEYVPGRSLDKLDGLKMGHWVLLFRQVASAMAHMHRRKVLHGDLKPSNVILSKAGVAKVLGYGRNLVKDKAAPRGTRLYMAPEQIKENTLDEKTDIYNLGATMYHVLTGQPANVGKRGDGEAGRISMPSALNPQIPSNLNNVIVTCLQSQPIKRPESMYDVHQKLDAIAKEMKLDDKALVGLASPGD